MSAPSPAPAGAPSARRVVLRLVGLAAFVAVGFGVVWQGFGAAGYGTDAHTHRVMWACFQLIGFGVALVCARGWVLVRSLVALAFFGSACVAWWTVRSSGSTGMSLREAAQARDWYKERLGVATAEEAETSDGMRSVKLLCAEYPSLCAGLPEEYERWANGVADDIAARYAKLPPDDFKRAEALVKPAKALSAAHPTSADRLDTARRQWLSAALGAKTNELRKVPPGEWDTFNGTAASRRALAEALPETRDGLIRAEDAWVDSAVESLVESKFTPKADEPAPRAFWKRAEQELLALNSLDTDDRRFANARGRLFKAAHDAAKAEALAHFEAGRYDRAFGVARAHAVEWSATAALLDSIAEFPREQRSLSALRTTYEFFDALAAKGTKSPELAPPPRPKP